MTVAVSQPTPKTTNLSSAGEEGGTISKRRRLMPLSPTSHDTNTTSHIFVSPDSKIPSIPSLSQINDNGSIMDLPPATGRPRQRTESFDAAFCFDPASVSPTVGQIRPRSNSNADHCIDHNSCNRREPPFAAKESDTFVAFTTPAKGATFGASSSFIGLRGLLPENARASQGSLAEAAALLRRNSSNVGLDMNEVDDAQSETEENEGQA